MADRGVEIVCAGNPNFAVICDYLKRFSDILGLKKLPIATLERMLEDKKHVARDLIDLHVRLMRRLKKSVPYDRWEKFLIRVCNMYSELDAWDLHQFGYKCLNVVTRLRILKHLLELQFDENAKFKQEVNKMVASQMRTLSVGRDLNGLTYWYQQDPDCNVRVYREEQDDTEEGQSWTIVAREREELANLISKLEFNLQNPTLKDETRSNTPSEIGEPQRVQDLDSIKSEQHVDLKQGVHENGIDSRSIEEVKKEPDKTLSDKSGIIGKVKSEVDSGGSPQQDEKYLPCDKSVAPTHVKSPHEGDAQNVSSLSSTTELHEVVVVKSEPLCAESGGTEVASELAPAVTSFGDELSARLSASDEPVSVVDNETEKREAVTTATSERTDIVSEVGGTSVKEASAVCLVQGDAVTATDDSDANEMRIVAAKDTCDKQTAVCLYNSAGKTQSPCSVEGNQQLVVHNQSEQEAANETHGEVASDDSGKISIQAAVEDGPGKQPVKAVSDMEPGETCVRPASADENSEKPIQPVLGEGCGDEPESSNSLVKCEPGDKDVKRDKSVDESDKDDKKSDKDIDKGENDVVKHDETVDKSDKGDEAVDKREKGDKTVDKSDKGDERRDETVDKSDKGDETVDKSDKSNVNHDETVDKSDKGDETVDKSGKGEKTVDNSDKGEETVDKSGKGEETVDKSDKGEETVDKSDKGEETVDKSDKGEETVDNSDKGDETVDKSDKGDETVDKIDKGDVKRDETVDKSDKGDETVDKSDKGDETVDKSDKGDETVDKSDKRDETVDKSDKGDETVDKIDKGDETVDKIDKGDVKRDETVDKSDKGDETVDKSDKGDETVEKSDKGDETVDKSDKGEETVDKSDKGEETVDKSGKGEETVDKSDKGDETVDKSDKGDKTVGKNDKGDVNHDETVDNKDKVDETVDKSDKGDETVDKSGKGDETVDKSDKGNETVDKSDKGDETVDKSDKGDKTVGKNDKGDVNHDETVDNKDKVDETVDKRDKGDERRDETVDKRDKADETVDKHDKGDVNHDETFDKSDKDVEKCDKIVDESEKCVKEKDKGIDNIEKDLKKSDKGDKEHDENNKNVESGDKSESARDEIKDDNKNVDKNSKGDANGDNVDEKKTAGKAKPAGTLVKKGRKKKTDFLMPPELVDTPIRRSLRPRRQPPPPPVVEQILDSDELSDEEPKKNNKRKNKEDSDDEFVPTVSKSHRRKQLDSDMESEDEEGEVVAPKQRARTVKKTRDDGESDGEAEDDKPCTRCHEGDHPEWILLCDSCDAGYHTACLRPPLMDVPDGNWYCPPCEHKMLLEKLQEQLLDLDNELKEQDRLQKRQDRLDFVNVSLSNVLEKKRKHKRQRVMDSDEDDDENKENEEDEDQEEDGEDEEEDDDEEDSDEDTEWLRRSRRTRQEISYKFEEFDELIEDAVKDDIKEERVIPPGRNRGKDMTNITGLPPEDELPPVVARKGRHRRLTNLDASSETEEDAEDEEFKVTSEESSEKSEESPSMSEASDDSWAWRRRRRCPKPSRRSTRSAKGKRKKGFYRYKGDWVVDDEDSEASSDDYTTVRRRKVTKNVRYKEDSDTSSSASLPVHRRMTGKQRDTESGSWSGSGSNSDRVGARGVKRQKISSGKRKRIVVPQASDDDDDDDDDDVEDHSNGGHAASSKRKLESDSDESGNKSGPSSACKRKNYRKVIGSESDDDSDVDDGKDSKGKSKVRAVNAKRSTRRASGHHVIESSDENDEDSCSQSRSSKSKTTKTSRVSHSETEEDSDDSGEEDPPTRKKDAKVKATAKRGTSRKDAQIKPSKKAETESKYEDEESNQSSEADDDDDDGDEDDDEEEEEEEEDENSDGDEEDKEEDEGNKPLSSKNKTQQLTPAKTSAMAKEGTKMNPPNVGSQKSEEEVEGREVQAAIAVHDSDATIPCKSVPSQRSEIQSESGAEANTVSEQRQKGNKAETENAETVQKEVDCKTGLATVGINSVTAVESTPVELDEQRKRSETFPLKEPESTKVETVKAGKAGKIRKEGNDVTAQPMPTKTRAQQSRAAKKRGVLPTPPTHDVTQDTKTEADQSGEDNKEAVSDQDMVSPQVSQPVASNTCSGGMEEDQCKESALIPNSQDGKDERLPDKEKNPVLHELPSREPEDISRHSGSQQEPDEHTRDKTLSALEPPNDMPDGAHVPCKRVTKAGKAKRQRPPRKRGASKAAAAAAADSGNDVSEGSMNAPLGASRNAALEPRWIENELQGKSGGADYEAAVRDGRMDVQSREESREPSRDETRIAKDLDDNERRDSVGSDLQSGDELGARGENLGVPGTNMEAGAREMLPRGEKIGANPQGPPGSSLDRLQAHIEHVFQHEGPPPQLGRESGFPSQAYTRAEHPSMYSSKEDGNAFQHVGMGSEVAGVPLGPSGAFNGGARYYPGPMFQQRGPAPHGHFAHAGVPPYQVSHAGSPYQQGAPPYHGASTPPYPNASHYSPRPTAPPYQHGGGGGAAGREAQFQRASPSYLQAHAHQYPQAAYGYPHGPHPGGQMAPMRHQASPTRGQASPPQRGSPTQQVSPPMRQSVIQPVPVRSSGAGFMIANILRDTRETLDPELSGDEAEPEYLEL